MYQPTLNDDSLKNGLKVSTALHVALFLFLYFGLPHMIPPLPDHHDPIPFEIVTVADITNTRIKDDTPTPTPPAPPPQPQPKPAPAPTPPPPPPPEVKPAPPAPAPPTPPEPIAEALKPKVDDKPKPVEKPPAPQPDLASVLKNVAKMKPAETPVVKAPDQKTDVKAPAKPAASAAPSLSDRLTISEEDGLRRQIEQCWNPPIGARDAQTLIVELVIDVNPDRTVANAEIVDKSRYASDSFFRAAADSAMRAVRNPQCSPLILPPDKYDQWKRIDFTFDPRDML